MQRHNFKIIICGYLFANFQFASLTSADTELSQMRDCNEIGLEAVIDQDLSREENLARLSQQFFRSVNKVDYCDRKTKNDDTGTSSPDYESTLLNAEAEQTTTGNDETSAFNNTEIQNTNKPEKNSASVGTTPSQTTTSSAQYDTPPVAPIASSSLVGTNFEQNVTEPNAPSGPNMASNMSQPTSVDADFNGTQRKEAEQYPRLTNGKTPDDIPDSDNDSVFEAQIRAAAMAETNPDTKKNLWNEYRRYKGLPKQQ